MKMNDLHHEKRETFFGRMKEEKILHPPSIPFHKKVKMRGRGLFMITHIS